MRPAGRHWRGLAAGLACLLVVAGLPCGATASHVHVVSSEHPVTAATEGSTALRSGGQGVATAHNSVAPVGASHSNSGSQEPSVDSSNQLSIQPSDSNNNSSSSSQAGLSAADEAGGREAGEGNLEGGLHVDSIGAEAAARPAGELPAKYPVKGLIDVQSPIFSEEPGVLVPLAQARSGTADWLAALEAAGSGTPLSDPMFVGTVFIPNNEAFERAYPNLRKQQQLGRSASEAFANITHAGLALQLNCLTVPGQPLKLRDLRPGRVLKTAGVGALQVVSSGSADAPVVLQHLPSAVSFTVVEADLQSGSSVGHVVDTLLPEAAVTAAAAATQAAAVRTLGQYKSAVRVLQDPALHLGAFAFFVQQAGLADLLASPQDAFTLFAPSDAAFAGFMSALTPNARHKLLNNATLADQLVTAHLVLGMALGSAALEALLPAGQLKTPQGTLAVLPANRAVAATEPQSSEAVAEAGHLAPAAAAADKPVARLELAAASAPEQQAVLAEGRGSRFAVADARVTAPNLIAGKAVVHVLDKVLVPPGLQQDLGVRASPGYTHSVPPPLRARSSAAAASLLQPLLLAAIAAASLAIVLT